MSGEPSTSLALADRVSPASVASLNLGNTASPRVLTALPVYNEQAHVASVLREVKKHATDILVVDDGSTDDTPRALAQCPWVQVVRHSRNLGYGAALHTAFQYAGKHRYEVLLTIDCDGQHEPQRIGQLVKACLGSSDGEDSSTHPFAHGKERADIVSGSRYLVVDESTGPPPEARRQINQQITREINRLLGLQLTDAFCGFKAYRVEALAQLHLTETGYAMPLELWVQAAHHGLRIVEQPVPLVYLDEERSFGGVLDNATARLAHYREVIKRSTHNCVERNCADRIRVNRDGAALAASWKHPPPSQASVSTIHTDSDPSGNPWNTPEEPAVNFLSMGHGPCS